MNFGRLLTLVVPLAAGPAGCVSRHATIQLQLSVRAGSTACLIETKGRRVDLDELLSMAKVEVKAGKTATIVLDAVDIPYRCLGGVIYTLQMAGFEYVSTVTKLDQ